MDCESIKPAIDTEKELLVSTQMNIWHRRLGHISDSNLIKVRNSTIGIKNPLTKTVNCKDCAQGKQNRALFKEPETRAENVLEIIHSEVCGPFAIKSKSGAEYLG